MYCRNTQIKQRLLCGRPSWPPGFSGDQRDLGGGSRREQQQGAQRLALVNGVASNVFLWEGDNLFAEFAGNGYTPKAEYSYFRSMDDLHSFVYWGNGYAQQYYAHRDDLGNVRGLTSSSGTVSRLYRYDAWGNYLSGEQDNFGGYDRARWKGALWMSDEAGLYYMRNRWYEPGVVAS